MVFSDNVYITNRNTYIRIWKFKSNKRLKTVKLPFIVDIFSINTINYNLCIQDDQYNIYLYDKNINLIKNLKLKNRLFYITVNNYYVFRNINQTKLILNKLNGEKQIEINERYL